MPTAFLEETWGSVAQVQGPKWDCVADHALSLVPQKSTHH